MKKFSRVILSGSMLMLLSGIIYTSVYSEYSTKAQNSKRLSDLSLINTSVSMNLIEGKSLPMLMKQNLKNRVKSPVIGGLKVISKKIYNAGAPNYLSLGIDGESLKDPENGSDYRIGIYNKGGGEFQLAAKLISEEDGKPLSYVRGTYSPRESKPYSIEKTTIGSKTIQFLTGASVFGGFYPGDSILIEGSKVAHKITGITSDGMTLKISPEIKGGSGKFIQLGNKKNGAISDIKGLIGNTQGIPVINGSTTAFPY